MKTLKTKFSKTLIKYVASYLAVLILPVAVTVLVSYSFFTKTFRNEVIEGRLKSLTLQVKDYELKLQQMENIVKQLEVESEVYNYDLQYSVTARMRLTETLNGYRLASSYIHDILYYHRGDNIIYSSSGTYNVKNYGTIMEKYNSWTQAAMEKDLETIDRPVFRAVDRVTNYNGVSGNYATFLYPLPYSSSAPYATVMFQVAGSELIDNTDMHEKTGEMFIINKDGFVIYKSQESSTDLKPLITKILSEKTTSEWMEIKGYKGESLLAIYSATADGKWVFLNVIPTDSALFEVVHIRNIFSILIFVSIILGIVLLCLFSYLNYKPLQNLKEHALLMFEHHQDSDGNKSNEVELAHKVLDMLEAQRQCLNVRLIEQKRLIRDMLLMRLVSGEFRNIEEFNLRAHENGIRFKKAFFKVIVFQLENISENIQNNQLKLICSIEAQMGKNMEALAYFNGSSRIVLLLGADDRDERTINDNINKIFLDFANEGLIATAGVGGFYSETFRLYVSFMEASTALDYRRLSDKSTILVFKEVVKLKGEHYNYPENEMQEIREAVINKRKDLLKISLEQISKKVINNKITLFSRILAYETINTLFKAVHHNNYGFVGIESYCSVIMEFNTTSEANRMWEIVFEIAEDISHRYMHENSSACEKSIIERVVEYIDEEYCNADFSIQKVADNFNISINNLSQQFKRHMGHTALEYVNNLRINKAKKMLSESDVTLKELVPSIGYFDESGFIRKFKQVVGMTPGEYRNKYRV